MAAQTISFPGCRPMLIQVFPDLSVAVPTQLPSQTWCLHSFRASRILKVDQAPSPQGGLHMGAWHMVVVLVRVSCKGLPCKNKHSESPPASPSQPQPGRPMGPFLLHPRSLTPSLTGSSCGSVGCRAGFYQCRLQTVASSPVFSPVAALLCALDLEMP